MTRRVPLGAVVLVAVLIATACGRISLSRSDGLQGTVIGFSISVGDSERPAIEEILNRFERRTRAKVDLEQLTRSRGPLGASVRLVTDVPSGKLADRLRADAAAGRSTISLFAQDNVGLSELVDKHLVQELDGLVDEPEDAIESLVPKHDSGKRYFLPFRPNVRIAYARTSDFEKAGVEPPETEDDLVQAAAALKWSGPAKVTLSLADGDAAAVTIAELIVSHEGDPLVLNDPGSVAAFTFLQRLWRERLISSKSMTAQWDTEVDNLAGKESSLAENWSFTSAQLAKLGELHKFQVYPGWRGPAEAHVIGGDVLGIPTGVKGKQLQAAEALANFLMSREAQEILVMRNAWPSFRNDIDYDSTVPDEQRPTFAAIKAALEHGWYRPFVSYWPDVSAALNDAVIDILWHDDDVQPVLDRLHDRIRAAAAARGAVYPATPGGG